MRPTWLIEAGVYDTEADPLLAAIRRQGMAAEVVPFRTLLKEKDIVAVGRPLAEGDCVLGYGTFPFARQIQLHRRWVPGAWCDPANQPIHHDSEFAKMPPVCELHIPAGGQRWSWSPSSTVSSKAVR